MPRKGKLEYTEEQLQNALVEVKAGKSINSTAKKYGVPASTLRFRSSEKFSKVSLGPATILSAEEEKMLEDWLVNCSKKGFPRNALDLRLSVKEFLDANPRPNPFTDNCPGRGWLSAFYKRHPNLSLRKPEGVSRASACVSEEDIRGWFTNVEQVLKDEGVFEVLSCPKRVFNGDEIGFKLCPQKNLVIALKGLKDVYDVDVGDAKASVTTMFSFSAAGDMAPPMLVYPYQRVPRDVAALIPQKWYIGRSDKGWMTSEVFFEYIANDFHTFLTENKIERPVILFIDGHKSHLTLQISNLCRDMQIVLVALYPNSTRILQPCDVAMFHPIKSGWNKAVGLWRKDHPHEAVTKAHVAPILSKVLASKDLKQTCINGFRVTGLCPWDANAINYEKCLGQKRDAVEQQSVEPVGGTKSLSFDTFCEVIGNERVKIFTAMQNEKQEAEENILYQVWMAFHRSGENTVTNAPLVESAPSSDSKSTAVAMSVEPKPGTSASGKSLNCALESEDSDVDEPVSIVPPATPSPLENHLFWPEEPKRKGVRNVERVPFVISSGNYQEVLNAKAEKKANEEREKEDRKRQREDNRKQKEDAKKKKEDAKTAKKLTPSKPTEKPQNTRTTRSKKT